MPTSFRLSAAERMTRGACYGAAAGLLFWLLWRHGLPAASWQLDRLPPVVAIPLRYLLPSSVAGAAAGALYGSLLPRVYRLEGALAVTAGTLMLFTALVQLLAFGFIIDGLFVSSLVVAGLIGLPAGILARDGVIRLAPDLEPLERRTSSFAWELASVLQRLPVLGPRLRALRRARLARQPFPTSWLEVLQAHVPVFRRLPHADQQELQQRVLLFLAEKRIEGRGLIVNDAVRVTIAAQACLLTLRLQQPGIDGYARLRTIRVYPRDVAPQRPRLLARVLARERARRAVVMLSWKAVSEGAADPDDGDNAVLHEFAHQLDRETAAAVEPALEPPLTHARWVQGLHEEYERVCRAHEAGHATVLGGRGAASAAEFFAVATEVFFERPHELRAERPALYRQLQAFYRQDPIDYVPAELVPTAGQERQP